MLGKGEGGWMTDDNVQNRKMKETRGKGEALARRVKLRRGMRDDIIQN